MAVANSLAAIENGARQVECAINGIGERAGNAALEEIVMALDTRKRYYNVTTGVKTEELFRSSQMLCELTGGHNEPLTDGRKFREGMEKFLQLAEDTNGE